jgi:Trk K+ transport system NAD-binding subunit
MISLEGGKLMVVQRTIHSASAVVGVSLEELSPPHGLLVGAVARGARVFVPTAQYRFETGDQAILFVHRSELPTVRLLFPGPEESG